MLIEVKNLTIAGNNARAEMFFDGVRASEIQCTPAEYQTFGQVLAAGSVEARYAGVDVALEFVSKT